MTAAKVVDASALAAVAFEESRAEEMAAQLRGCRLYAPALLHFELAHVCLKKIGERPAERDSILKQMSVALELPVQLESIEHHEVVTLGARHNLSAYDASYLWLAGKLGIALVTGDTKLGKAATKL